MGFAFLLFHWLDTGFVTAKKIFSFGSIFFTCAIIDVAGL